MTHRAAGFVHGCGVLLVLLGVAPSCGAQETNEAVRANGQRLVAALAGIDDAWQPIWRDAALNDAERDHRFVAWGAIRDRDRGTAIVLAEGSVLAAEVRHLDAGQLIVESPLFGTVTIPRAAVRGVLWRPPADALERDRLILRLARESRSTDQLWMANGDELAGTVAAGETPPMTPAVTPAEMAVIRLTVAERAPIVVPIENALALGLSWQVVPRDPAPARYGVVALRDGSRLWATRITAAELGTRIQLRDGLELLAPADRWENSLAAVQWFDDEFVYLSDLPVVGYKHIPLLTTAWDFGVDRNLLGGQLRVGSRLYPKGLAMHSTARLAFAVDGGYRQLAADVAIDDAAKGHGSAVFRVFAERPADPPAETAWQVLWESPVIRGGDAPVPVTIDISRVTRLALVVDFADRGDAGDHADWLNVRLVR